MSKKYITKNERHLRLAAHIITKLSQSVYLVNTHILKHQKARYDWKLYGTPLILLRFFGYFQKFMMTIHV